MNEGTTVITPMSNTSSSPLFELGAIDLGPITATLMGAAAVIIPAVVGYILIKKGVGIIPAMISKLIKG